MNTENDIPPKLWNPNGAACWSLLFTPAFGSFLHAKNAENLRRHTEARSNWIWFYTTIIFLLLSAVSLLLPIIPEAFFNISGLVILLGWYFSTGKKQISFTKEALGGNYAKRKWTQPLMIGIGGVLIYLIVVSIFGFLSEVILHTPEA